jgi:hypothetical protein
MTNGSGNWRGGNSGIIVHGDFNAGQVAVGDRAQAVMNVGPRANLRIGSRHGGGTKNDPRAMMQALLKELEGTLSARPGRRTAEADLVLSLATQLVRVSERPDTERSTLQHIGKGLRDTLGLLKGIIPDAIVVGRQLVSLVASLHGLNL